MPLNEERSDSSLLTSQLWIYGSIVALFVLYIHLLIAVKWSLITAHHVMAFINQKFHFAEYLSNSVRNNSMYRLDRGDTVSTWNTLEIGAAHIAGEQSEPVFVCLVPLKVVHQCPEVHATQISTLLHCCQCLHRGKCQRIGCISVD